MSAASVQKAAMGFWGIDTTDKEYGRCLFHPSTASAPGFALGTPRSSVASGAGLKPGALRRVLAQD